MRPAANLLTQSNFRKSRQHRRAQLRKQLCIESLEERRLLAADVAPIVDINAVARSSSPNELVEMGGVVYFSATTDEFGSELWKSDGTQAGTVLVKDIRLGTSPGSPTSLVNVNGVLYFRATNGTNGQELWKSDGTAAGTVMVKDISTGDGFPQYMTNVGGTVYFRANDGVNGGELWKSDGTAAGTMMVKDIRGGSSPSGVSNLVNVNGTLFFRANDGATGYELWKSDGTDAGTVRVIDIIAGASSSTPARLTNVNGSLFFAASDSVNGFELWKSDGTTAGTTLVKDINPGTSGSSLSNLTTVGSVVFFTASTAVNGYQLWKSDGTTAGTVLVKSIRPFGGSGIGQLVNVSGNLFFQANNSTNGYELWKSDGSSNGTVLVKDISPGTFHSSPQSLTNVSGTLYFRAKTETTGYELWKSDGTDAGTVQVKEIRAGIDSSTPISMTNVNGTAFFRANDGTTGFELWKSNGSEAGTVLVADILPQGTSSTPQHLAALNGQILFSADDGLNGRELWKSDGTANGTVLVKDIFASAGNSTPRYLTEVGGSVYFIASTPTNGEELWKSDGTAAGTVMVKDIVAGTSGSYPNRLTNVNGVLYFVAVTSATGQELWKSDGTAAGTVLVKDILPGSAGSGTTLLTNVNGTVYFRANDNVNGYELWKSDGTDAGTVMVKNIRSGGSGSVPNYLTNVGGVLFFRASDGVQGYELWKSDGTSAGTVVVKDIRSGSLGSNPGQLSAFNNQLFFRANDGVNGYELWKSDGTNAGTVLFKDVSPGVSGSGPGPFVPSGDSLFFIALTGTHGFELWKTDGTSSGTSLVKDIRTGATGSYPLFLTDVNGTLYFQANDGVNGLELWKSDGTEAGTVLAADIASNAANSNPQFLTAVGTKLFFAANTLTYGSELYVVEAAPSIPTSILLSSNSVAENNPSGTIVGALSTIGSQPASTTFQLLGNPADFPFIIEGNTLKTSAVLDYEFTNYYSLLVQATSGGVSITRELAIFVSPVNEFDPTLTSSTTFSVVENSLNVISLSASDSDSPISQFTFSKVGGPDASRFTISGNQLAFVTAPSFESPLDSDNDNQYLVQVAVSDGSRSQTSTLTVVVTDVNEAPIGLTLSSLSFPESLPAGSVVGTLSAADEDGPFPLSFAFSTLSPNDNADFEIVGNQLRTRREFDFETSADQELTVRLLARDALNATSSPTAFTITLLDEVERPIANNVVLTTNQNTIGAITLSGDVASPTFTITQQPLRGTLSGTAPNLIYTPNLNYVGSDQFFYTVNSGSISSYEAQVDITVVGILPTVTFQYAQAGLNESPTFNALPIRVNLSVPATTDLVVGLTLAPGTATSGQDFSAPTQILVRAGDSFGTGVINIVDDAIDEDMETFKLQIVPSSEYLVGSTSSYEVFLGDNDAPPAISLDRTSLTSDEANRSFSVRVQLSAATTQAIQLPYTLTMQGATLGSDFTISGGSGSGGNSYLAIPAGATSAFLTVQVIDDTTIESLESLNIQFGQPSYGTLQNPSASDFTLTIRDNDERIITLQYSLVTVGESVGTVNLIATASPPFTESTTVPIALGGTASASVVGRDYLVDSPFAFVFGANQGSATLPVRVVDDLLVEPREEINVRLIDDSPTYKLGATSQTIVSIVDNDNATLSFDNPSMDHWEGVGTVPIRVSLTRALSQDMTIPLVLSSGTGFATKGTDYVFNATSITIPAGQTTATASLQIVDDLNNEPNESVRIAFGTLPANAQFTLGDNQSSTTLIRDNDPLLSVTTSSSTAENGTAEFKISLSARTHITVQALLTISGTSTFNVDYTRPISGNFSMYNNASIASNSKVLVTIPDGVETLYFRLPIVDDSIFEGSETITVGIQSLTSEVGLSSARSASTSITDNDGHAVSISTPNSNISEARLQFGFAQRKNRTKSIAVEMAQPATRDISVSIAFGGTAKFNSDYKVSGLDAKTGLIIKKGNKTASFTLEIISDSLFEGNETIEASIVAISSPGTLVNPISKGTYTIMDDDQPPGSSGGGFGLWGGADDAEAIARMRAAIAQSNQPLTIAGTSTLAIDTQPKIGPIFSASQTTTARDVNGKAIPQTILAGATTTGTVLVATGSKGPVDGAVAFFDLNRNGVLDFVDSNGNGTQDEDEISEQPFVTATDGSFAFSPDDLDINGDGVVEAHEGRLVLAGGTDISTGLVGLIPLTAPVGLYNITPLSTIAESLVRTMNLTVLDAMNRTTQAFGIENYSLAEGVSLYQVLGNDALAARAYSAHVQIYSVAVGLAQFFAGVSGRDVGLLGSAVFDEMATYITADDSTFDLASSDALVALAQSVIEKQGISSVSNSDLTAAATAIANGILEIQKVQLTTSTAGAGEEFLLSIYKAKKVVQGILPTDLNQLGSGQANRNAAYIDSTYTPSGITGLVALQTANVTVPPVVGVDSLSILEGDTGQKTLVFTVTLLGSHNYPVSVNYSTVDATATATTLETLGDYQSQSGTLSWPAGDNALKYISIPIEGDADFEADEYFRMLLSNPTGLVIRAAEGRGFILNQDLLLSNTTAVDGQTTSETLLSLSDGQTRLIQNAVETFAGLQVMPTQGNLQGQANISDQWIIDFSENKLRADTWTFDAKSGATDEMLVQAGGFALVDYTIQSANASQTRLKNDSLEGELILNSLDIESTKLFVSSADRLIVRVPGTVGPVIVEDADVNATGRMRIRSTNGSFAPIEFTNPGVLEIRRPTAATNVSVDSLDPAFSNSNLLIVNEVVDTTRPISAVQPLATQATSLTIPLTIVGSDPAGAEGAATGILEFELHVAVDNGPYSRVAVLPANTTTYNFIATSNHNYYFRSLARDNAGNLEANTGGADAFTWVRDFDKPETSVTAANFDTAGLFTITVSGRDLGGSQLTRFDVYAVVDSNAATLIGSINAGSAGAGGLHTGSLNYQGLTDGAPHAYRFYTRGLDSVTNLEDAPISGDVVQSATFAIPAGLQATGIDVQLGAKQRSFVQYVDVMFNSATNLSQLLTGGRVQIEKFGLTAATTLPGTGQTVSATVTQPGSGNRLRLDFGTQGLGGSRNALTGDGFYRVRVDSNRDNDFDDAGETFEFHRLLGDANGDGLVDALDTAVVDSLYGRLGSNLDGDLNGDGVVNLTDKSFTMRTYRNRFLASQLRDLLDD